MLLTARNFATAILNAWSANNPAVLVEQLVFAAQNSQIAVGDSGESERRELVGAIASTMRVLLEFGQRAQAAQYVPLLRHLASPPPARFDCAFRC